MTLLSPIKIKAYRKFDFRILLMNPDIDLKDERAVMDALPMEAKRFQKLLKEKLSGKVPESEWLHVNILSADIVKLIVSPDQPANGKKAK